MSEHVIALWKSIGAESICIVTEPSGRTESSQTPPLPPLPTASILWWEYVVVPELSTFSVIIHTLASPFASEITDPIGLSAGEMEESVEFTLPVVPDVA